MYLYLNKGSGYDSETNIAKSLPRYMNHATILSIKSLLLIEKPLAYYLLLSYLTYSRAESGSSVHKAFTELHTEGY